MDELTSLDDYDVDCARCEKNRYVLESGTDRERARVCPECFETCPACDDENYIYRRDERGYQYAERCPVCGTLKRRIDKFNEAGIPVRYNGRRATFDNFETEDDRGQPLGNLPGKKIQLFQWVREFSPGEKGFLLHGPVGTGKTHLLAAVVRHLTLEKGIASRFVEFTHLLGRVREQFDEGRSEAAVLGPLSESSVLAIDELGKGRNTDWQLSVLDQLISKRYNRGLTTLFTTNFELGQQRDGSGVESADFQRGMERETLRERLGERIFSRLHEMVEFIELDAPDYRKWKGEG